MTGSTTMGTVSEGFPPEPRRNADLFGHEGAENILKSAFESGRLPHAWLITGPRGIGKATLAYRFARYVLKHSAVGLENLVDPSARAGLFGDLPDAKETPLGDGTGLSVPSDDRTFRRVAALGHADFIAIERQWKDDKKLQRKTIIPVDDVRQVGGFLRLTPAEGGWRIVVVDAADEMNQNAANALLKVLEEPPSRSLLLLISHSPGRLLPTIRSRCRRLPLRPLPNATVQQLLQAYAPEIGTDEAATLVRLAEGSIGRALEMLDEGGLDIHGEVMELLSMLPRLDVTKLHKLGDKLARRDAEAAFRSVHELLQWMFSRVIRVAATGNPGSILSEREQGLVNRLSELATLDRWLEVWEKVTRLLERAEGANLDRKQVILNVFHTLGRTVTR